MKRKIKAFLNGETGSRVSEDSPKLNHSEKRDSSYLVVILEGGYNAEADEFHNEEVEVLWSDDATLNSLKVGTTVIGK